MIPYREFKQAMDDAMGEARDSRKHIRISAIKLQSSISQNHGLLLVTLGPGTVFSRLLWVWDGGACNTTSKVPLSGPCHIAPDDSSLPARESEPPSFVDLGQKEVLRSDSACTLGLQ